LKDILFITVQYNNPADTEAFLKSLSRIRDASECDVIVVDNSSVVDAATDRLVQHVVDVFEVRLLRPARNLYYWGGAAFALESLVASGTGLPRWVVVCNNDLIFDDAEFVHKLHGMDPIAHPVIAPAIISQTTGNDQNPILETFPGPLKRAKWRLYDVSYAVAQSLLAAHRALRSIMAPLRKKRQSGTASTPARRIYAPHGACMIFSSSFFARGGTLDTKVPLFAEELTIAAQSESLDLPVWYWPSLRVLHREHSTTGSGLTRAKYEMERNARRRYYEYGNAVGHRAPNRSKSQ
jgi:GT2 family glycosyltransferase